MFKALFALAQSCANVTLSITANADATVTVIIAPKPKEGVSDGALKRPLSLTGTPEELDEKFIDLVGEYAQGRKSLEEQLESTKSVLDAAAKAAKDKASKAVVKASAGGKAAAAAGKPETPAKVPLVTSGEGAGVEEPDELEDPPGSSSAASPQQATAEAGADLFA